mmetsp:Transcript_39842/g.84959  ORF Transcript_39842/g.84959 Transcript_39842/m.84959 type:complete len:112 (-) Transcript_39842:553-888(-)
MQSSKLLGLWRSPMRTSTFSSAREFVRGLKIGARLKEGWEAGNGAEKGSWNLRPEFITYEMIGKRFQVHTGKQYITVKVGSGMVGHKFGEFAPTRKKCVHPKKDKGGRGKK